MLNSSKARRSTPEANRARCGRSKKAVKIAVARRTTWPKPLLGQFCPRAGAKALEKLATRCSSTNIPSRIKFVQSNPGWVWSQAPGGCAPRPTDDCTNIVEHDQIAEAQPPITDIRFSDLTEVPRCPCVPTAAPCRAKPRALARNAAYSLHSQIHIPLAGETYSALLRL
jgi:hypothetical protein